MIKQAEAVAEELLGAWRLVSGRQGGRTGTLSTPSTASIPRGFSFTTAVAG